jgi:hypothetical protein
MFVNGETGFTLLMMPDAFPALRGYLFVSFPVRRLGLLPPLQADLP